MDILYIEETANSVLDYQAKVSWAENMKNTIFSLKYAKKCKKLLIKAIDNEKNSCYTLLVCVSRA